MSEQNIDFGANEIFPVNCVNAFAGYNTNAEGEVNEVLLT
jgi:hypothetical protein